MRVLVVGAGGVGSAVARTVARWNLFERVVMADYDEGRAQRAIAGGGDRFAAYRLDARDEQAIGELIKAERCDAVLNALDPSAPVKVPCLTVLPVTGPIGPVPSF